MWGVPSAPVRVPTKGQFPRVSRQSRLFANDKGDNEMILEAERSNRKTIGYAINVPTLQLCLGEGDTSTGM